MSYNFGYSFANCLLMLCFCRKCLLAYRSKLTKNYTVDWLFKNIQYLGHVFDFSTDFFDQYIILQDLLDIIDVNNASGLYDTQDKFEFKVIVTISMRPMSHAP